MMHAVGEMLGDVAGVVGEGFRRVARLPTVGNCLRQIPVKHRDVRLDAVRAQFIDEAIVEVEPLWIRLAGAVGEYARPRDRQAKTFAAQTLQRLNVFFVEMIKIVGDIAGVAVVRLASCVRERVPDRWLAAVFVDGTFDLIRRGGASPQKARWKFQLCWLADLGEREFGKGSGCECCGGGCGRGLSETA